MRGRGSRERCSRILQLSAGEIAVFEPVRINFYAGKRIRTSEGTKPRGPKPRPLDRSGIPASIGGI